MISQQPGKLFQEQFSPTGRYVIWEAIRYPICISLTSLGNTPNFHPPQYLPKRRRGFGPQMAAIQDILQGKSPNQHLKE